MCGGADLNYLWEVLLAGQKAEIPQEVIRFAPAVSLSPYLEAAFDDLNPLGLVDEPVEINALYRFAPIFDRLLDGGMKEHPEIRDCLFDAFMHLLGWIDLHSGLCRNEYYGLFLKRDIQKQRFGKVFCGIITEFPFEQRRFVTEHLVRLYTLGPSIELLRSLLRSLYTNSMLYLDTTDQRELLIYIGRKETPLIASQIDFLLTFFVPFDYIVHLFWEFHFGIIGIDETMEIDEINIY